DLRILSDRQGRVGDAADQKQNDGKDRGEDRPVDEKVREPHRFYSLRRGGLRTVSDRGQHRHVRSDLDAGADARETVDDDCLITFQSGADPAITVDARSCAHGLRRYHAVISKHVDDAAILIAAYRLIRNENTLIGIRSTDADAPEKSWLEEEILVVKN